MPGVTPRPCYGLIFPEITGRERLPSIYFDLKGRLDE